MVRVIGIVGVVYSGSEGYCPIHMAQHFCVSIF